MPRRTTNRKVSTPNKHVRNNNSLCIPSSASYSWFFLSWRKLRKTQFVHSWWRLWIFIIIDTILLRLLMVELLLYIYWFFSIFFRWQLSHLFAIAVKQAYTLIFFFGWERNIFLHSLDKSASVLPICSIHWNSERIYNFVLFTRCSFNATIIFYQSILASSIPFALQLQLDIIYRISKYLYRKETKKGTHKGG